MEQGVSMYTGEKITPYAPVTALMLIIAVAPLRVDAEEIAAFKLTDTDGYFGLRYRYDDNEIQQLAATETRETRSSFDEEAHVQTQWYVYHPNFLKVDLGAGILFNQEKLKTVSAATRNESTLYDFNSRFMFLENKPYPLTLYYDKSHPSVALNVIDVFTQENEKYGLNFSIREPVSPVTLNFESYNQTNKGSSFTQITNDKNIFQNVSAQANLLNGGYVQLSYTDNKQTSFSGSKSLPITPFNVTSQTTDFNSRIVFGNTQDINLNILAAQTIQKQDRNLKEFRFSPILSWIHNDHFNSFYRYNLIERKQLNIDTRNSSGAAGMGYQWDDNLSSTAEVHYDDSSTTGLTLSSYGGNGSITYKYQMGDALMTFNVGLNYDTYDRQAASSVQVLNEPHVLLSTAPFYLAQTDVDKTSIKIYYNNNLLTEGTDYQAEVIGTQVRITRLGTSIYPDNINVLVNYLFNPGGDAAYTSIGQSYQASVEFYKHTTFYMNYRDSKQNLKTGMPTLPLESSDTTSFGMRFDYPLPTENQITLGGNLLQEKYNETVSSYRKNSADVYLQMALPLSSDLHLSLHRTQVDYLSSAEDVDLTRYSMRLKSSPANRLTLIFQLDDEKDIGSSLPRSSQNLTFSSQWRIRQLLLEVGAKRIFDTQGSIKHTHNLINANLRRDF